MRSSIADDYIDAGNELRSAGDYVAAIVSYNQALRLDPDNVRAYMGRGRSYRWMEAYSQAIIDFETVISLDPQQPRAYYLRGLSVYQSREDCEAARADWQRFNELNTEDVGADPLGEILAQECA